VVWHRGRVSESDRVNWTTFTTADGLAEDEIWALSIDGADHTWVGYG
jgi:hypothetical protein